MKHHHSLYFWIINFTRSIPFWREWLEVNQPWIIRTTSIFVLFACCVYVVPRVVVGSHQYPLILLIAVVGCIALAIAIRYPFLGFIAAIPAAMVVPFGIGTGTGSNLSGAVLIVAGLFGLWLLGMVVKREFHWIKSPVILPAVLMIVSALISFVVGQMPWFLTPHASIAAQVGGVLMFVLAMGCLLTAMHNLNLKALEWMVWVFLGISTIFIVSRWQGLSISSRFMPGATGAVFWVWLAALAVGQLLYNRRLNLGVKIWLLLLLAVTIWVMFVQGRDWTSGWMPAMAGIGVMIWIGSKRMRVPLILMGLLVVFLQRDRLFSMLMTGDNEYSLWSRLEAWKIMFRIIAVNPITGVGPSNYYNYTYIFKIAGYAVSFNSHNQYIDLLAQVGIVGFGLYLWLMVVLQKLALTLLGKVPSGFLRGFVGASVGAVAGTIIAGFLGDWVIPFVYNVGLEGFRASLIGWMFLGGLAAVDHWLITEPNLVQKSGGVDAIS